MGTSHLVELPEFADESTESLHILHTSLALLEPSHGGNVRIRALGLQASAVLPTTLELVGHGFESKSWCPKGNLERVQGGLAGGQLSALCVVLSLYEGGGRCLLAVALRVY